MEPILSGGGSNLMQTCGNFKVIFLTMVHEVWAGSLQGGHQRIFLHVGITPVNWPCNLLTRVINRTHRTYFIPVITG